MGRITGKTVNMAVGLQLMGRSVILGYLPSSTACKAVVEALFGGVILLGILGASRTTPMGGTMGRMRQRTRDDVWTTERGCQFMMFS